MEQCILKILHRVNDIDLLKTIPIEYGVEVDIHAYGSELITVHDAFANGTKFEDWLNVCGNRFVIFNIKEEGIETKVLEMIYKKKIDNFFLLDISFPFINKLVYKNEKNIAIRVSEYEPIELAYRMKSKINWIWLDCFNGFPLSQSQVKEINQIGLKICLVSPELHGLPRTKYEITHFKRKIKDYKLKVSAVCTKFPTLW